MSFLLRRGVISGSSQSQILATNMALLDGVDQHFTTPDNDVFTCTSFTMSTWFNSDDISINQNIMRNRPLGASGAGIPGFSFELRTSGISANTIVEDAAGNYVKVDFDQGTLLSSTWYQMVTTFGSNTLTIYINAVDQSVTTDSSGTVGSINATQLMDIGSIDGGRFFDGRMMFPRFWKNRVLNQTEITELYNSGTPLCFTSLSGGLKTSLAYSPRLSNWSSNSGEELDDQSGSGLVTTNVNSVPFTGTGMNVEC